jgi:hypothetical protein
MIDKKENSITNMDLAGTPAGQVDIAILNVWSKILN